MANTHHTGIPNLQWSFTYPPCVPSITIVADKNPFCLGDSVTFTPTFNCVDDITITAYGWVVNGTIQSTSSEPFVSNTLTNNDTVYLLIVTNNGQTYFSNVIPMQEKTEGCITEIKYGLLYNWYAATDVRNITSSDTWVVPTQAQYTTLLNRIDTYNSSLGYWPNAQPKLKKIGTDWWIYKAGITQTNETGFSGVGSGVRDYTGSFLNFKSDGSPWSSTSATTTDSKALLLSYTDNATLLQNRRKKQGRPIRFMRTATAAEQLLADGTACDTYTGNDGKIYRTVKIGTQVWLAANLAETKFRNDDYIHGFDGGVYTQISYAAWAALTTDGVCVYADHLNNM